MTKIREHATHAKKLEIIKNVQNFFVIMQTNLHGCCSEAVLRTGMKAKTCKRLKMQHNQRIYLLFMGGLLVHNLLVMNDIKTGEDNMLLNLSVTSSIKYVFFVYYSKIVWLVNHC